MGTHFPSKLHSGEEEQNALAREMKNDIEEAIVHGSSNLKQRIYEESLVDKYQPKETRIKLKPVKNDQKAFQRLFNESKEYIRESNLTTNYNYFYYRIQKFHAEWSKKFYDVIVPYLR